MSGFLCLMPLTTLSSNSFNWDFIIVPAGSINIYLLFFLCILVNLVIIFVKGLFYSRSFKLIIVWLLISFTTPFLILLKFDVSVISIVAVNMLTRFYLAYEVKRLTQKESIVQDLVMKDTVEELEDQKSVNFREDLEESTVLTQVESEVLDGYERDKTIVVKTAKMTLPNQTVVFPTKVKREGR